MESLVIPTDADAREALRKELDLRKLYADTHLRELELARALAAANVNQVFNYFGEVNSSRVETIMNDLGLWSRARPGSPLTVVFNSPGGLVQDGLALYDFLLHLRQQGHHLTTIAMGRAASMGGVLLQAGDRRVISPNAFILIHEVSAGTNGTVSEMEDSVNFFKRLQSKTVKILAHRADITEMQLRRRWKKTDWWLDADEAIALKFADFILGQEGSGSPSLPASAPTLFVPAAPVQAAPVLEPVPEAPASV
jgi:ATP-dependent Clp endopeptidase proteolytic subunit ClpP